MAEPITVRLTDEATIQLKTLATFDRLTLADEIREAIGLLLEARKNDPKYRERVRAAFDEARRELAALEGTEAILNALGNPPELQTDQSVSAAPVEVATAGTTSGLR
jgi:hypothetical protein